MKFDFNKVFLKIKLPTDLPDPYVNLIELEYAKRPTVDKDLVAKAKFNGYSLKLSNSESYEGNYISNKSKREGSIPANIQVNDSLKISWKIFVDRPSKFNIDTSYNFQKKITDGYMTVSINEESFQHPFNYTGKTVGEPIEDYIIDKFKSSTIGTINFDDVGFYNIELKINTSSQNPLQWQWLWLEEVTD